MFHVVVVVVVVVAAAAAAAAVTTIDTKQLWKWMADRMDVDRIMIRLKQPELFIDDTMCHTSNVTLVRNVQVVKDCNVVVVVVAAAAAAAAVVRTDHCQLVLVS